VNKLLSPDKPNVTWLSYRVKAIEKSEKINIPIQNIRGLLGISSFPQARKNRQPPEWWEIKAKIFLDNGHF
jgi:hypothetical protein